MRTFARLSLLLCFVAGLLAGVMPAYAAVEPYQQQLTGRIRQGDTLLLRDEKFQNPVWDWNMIRNHKVSNEITFSLVRARLHQVGKPFTAKVDLKVEYWSQPGQSEPFTEDHVALEVKFDTARGAVYKLQDVHRFLNGHRVKITVNSISSAELGEELPEIFTITSQVFVDRSYLPDPAAPPLGMFASEAGTQAQTPAMQSFSASQTEPAEVSRISLHWNTPQQAEQYDLEWTFIDETSSLGALIENTPTANRTDAFLHKFFRNNSTRVTLDESVYNINLVHYTKFLLVRVRTVAENHETGIREEGSWHYDILLGEAGPGAEPVRGVIELSDSWHHSHLNWQYNATYAEEGKRKEVVSYFDKSLKNRQSVTLLNNGTLSSGTEDITTIAQSVIYDEYGRAAMNMLPAPLFGEKTLKFYPALNHLKATGNPLTYQDASATGIDCNFKFPELDVLNGAGKYYSPESAFKTMRNHAFVPDAEGFPYSAQFYMNDNTGRISSQGGVGKLFQPDRDPSQVNAHSTRYFYSKPSQEELYRLFGNDVGFAAHYSKNTVIDPNGQLSISYLNLSGKTIATALSGANPGNLEALPSKPAEVPRTNTIFSPVDFTFDPSILTLSANQTYIAEQPGEMKFRMNLQKLVAKHVGSQINICSECAYEVVVTVADDCMLPADVEGNTVRETVPGTAPALTCSVQPADLDKEFTLNFSHAGAYYIRMDVKMREKLIREKADQFVAINNELKAQFYYISKELDSLDLAGCFSDCKVCKTMLGAKTDFVNRIRDKLASLGVNLSTNGTAINAWAESKYDALNATCTAARATCSDDPCEVLRNRLRLDVSPGGQYALFTADNQPLDTALNVLYKNWRAKFPVLPATDSVYKRHRLVAFGGDTISLNDSRFTLGMLVANWTPALADTFISYHPEHCGLLNCVNNESFLRWDNRVKTMANTLPEVQEFTGINFVPTNASWLVIADPYFSIAAPGWAQRNAFVADLNAYTHNFLKIYDAPVKHLGEYVDYTLYCGLKEGVTANSSTDWNNWMNCNPKPECRVPEREWLLYRKAYFELKQKYYQLQRNAVECQSACKVGTPMSASAGGCAPVSAFSLSAEEVSGTVRKVKVRHEGGAMARSTIVYIRYPAEFASTPGLVTQLEFSVGEAIDSFDIPATIPAEGIRVGLVTCAPGYGSMPCGGDAFTVNLGTHGVKTGANAWEGMGAGNTLRRYYVVRGLKDSLPNTALYCNGAGTAVYYHCLTFQYGGISEFVPNAWLITCPEAPCASAGTFAATAQSTSQIFSDGEYTIEIFPNTTPINNLEGTLCESPASAFYECYTVTYNGSTHTFRNATVFTCQFGPPCVPEESIYYTHYSLPKYFTDQVYGSEGRTYVMDGSQPCPSGTTDAGFINRFCVRFVSHPSTDSVEFFFKNKNIRVCNGLPNMGTLQSVPDVITFLLHPGGGGGTGNCPEGLVFKQSRLGEINYDAALFPDILMSDGANQLAQYQQSVCAGQADIWLERLDKCFDKFLPAQRQGKKDELRAKLIELCNKGLDISHPHGASTLPKDVTISGGHTSFSQVIKAIIDITQFTPDCNPWLLDGPYPYNTPLLAASPVITNTDDAICLRLQKIKQKWNGTGTFHQFLTDQYGAAMTLTAAELADLEQGCGNCRSILKTDIELPLFLVADTKGCITKTELTDALADLALQVPGMTDQHPEYERTITNYLNHKWGFGMGYAEYYKLTQDANPNARLCNTPAYKSGQPDPYACLMGQLHTAIVNGMRMYDQYIEKVKRQYRQDYISACSKTNGSLKLTSTSIGTYHYTLYYYDQAGNLVKTVPPEGVRLLSDEGMTTITEVAKSNDPCHYSGPIAETDMNLTKQHFNTSLNSGTRAIEMWLYNNEMPLGQVLVTSGVDGYMFNLCMGEDIMDVDVIKLDDAGGVINIDRTKHYRVSLDKSVMRPMMHVVLQGTDIGLEQGALTVYVNGSLRPAVTTDNIRGGCEWELGYENGQIKLPQHSTTIKHIRGYNSVLSASQVTAQYNMACMGMSNTMAGIPIQHWGRFNLGEPGGPTTSGNTGNETRYTKVYPQHGLNSTYSFNSLNGVVGQETPDGGKSHFWYDWLGRLVASRNAVQTGRLSYTVYDDQNRIREVGERDGAGWDHNFLNGTEVGTFLASGLSSRRHYTITKYDDPDTETYGTGANEELVSQYMTQDNLRKRVSASLLFENPESQPVATFYSYDMIGNVKSVLHKLPDFKFRKIDYNYDLASGKVRTVRYNHDGGSKFYYHYEYDAENRLTRAYTGHETSDVAGWNIANKKLEAAYYYYQHGPLARLELGGDIQGVDYAYTLQGWLKSINGERLAGLNDMGQDGVTGSVNEPFQRDVYAFSLNYHQGDYAPIGKTAPASDVFKLDWVYGAEDVTGRQLFNGNIARTTLALNKFEAGEPVGYSYRYDQLNRLTAMARHSVSGAGMSAPETKYGESITYDANGNILSYNRHGSNSLMDDLEYIYAYGNNTDGTRKLMNNRLHQVQEKMGDVGRYAGDIDGPQSFSYDAIGNLVKDEASGISEIKWTVYGKIESIIKTNGDRISYKYDAGGSRIFKSLETASGTSLTWYVRDAQGNTLAIYEQGAQDQAAKWREQHLYGSSRLGIWELGASAATTYSDKWDDKELLTLYELSNHLGNVVATVNGKYEGDDEATVVSMNDYYPFGMVMPGRSVNFGSSSYRYGFNGKENDNEVKGVEGSQQDYGMRIYDPRVAKFLSVDPIANQYPYFSPYHFAGNSPIVSIDIDGLEPSTPRTLWTKIGNINGQTIYRAPDKDKVYYVAEQANWDAHGNSYFQYTDPKTNKWAGNFTPTDHEVYGEGGFPVEEVLASQNRNQEYGKSWTAFQDAVKSQAGSIWFVEKPLTTLVIGSTGFIGGGGIVVAERLLINTEVRVVANEAAATTAAAATNGGGQLLLKPAAAKLTQKGLDHIISRHWFTSSAKGAGKFAKGTTGAKLKSMINTATTQGVFRANTMGRAGTIAEYNFGSVIGTTSSGAPASSLRVVIGKEGNVITAFPF